MKDKKLYIGFTEDFKQRIHDHNKGWVNATKNRRPFELMYYEVCLNKDLALKREKFFKTGYGRRFLKNRLNLSAMPEIN